MESLKGAAAAVAVLVIVARRAANCSELSVAIASVTIEKKEQPHLENPGYTRFDVGLGEELERMYPAVKVIRICVIRRYPWQIR